MATEMLGGLGYPIFNFTYGLLREAGKLADRGDWRQVASIVDWGLSVEPYMINGEQVWRSDIGMQDFMMGGKFALNIFPDIYGDGSVSGKINQFIEQDPELWEKYAMGEHQNLSRVARGVITTAIKLRAISVGLDIEASEEIRNKLEIVRGKLNNKLDYLKKELQAAQAVLGTCDMQVDLLARLREYLRQVEIEIEV